MPIFYFHNELAEQQIKTVIQNNRKTERINAQPVQRVFIEEIILIMIMITITAVYSRAPTVPDVDVNGVGFIHSSWMVCFKFNAICIRKMQHACRL